MLDFNTNRFRRYTDSWLINRLEYFELDIVEEIIMPAHQPLINILNEVEEIRKVVSLFFVNLEKYFFLIITLV